jgi:hypothetical protein
VFAVPVRRLMSRSRYAELSGYRALHLRIGKAVSAEPWLRSEAEQVCTDDWFEDIS